MYESKMTVAGPETQLELLLGLRKYDEPFQSHMVVKTSSMHVPPSMEDALPPGPKAAVFVIVATVKR